MTITVVATPSVRSAQLQSIVAERGLDWAGVGHVGATTTLADAILQSGQFACPIGPLISMAIDAIGGGPTHAGFPGKAAFQAFAAHGSGYDQYRDAFRTWTRNVRSRRLGSALRFDEALRSFARVTAGGAPAAALLVRSRRQFENSIRLLVQSGFSPDDVTPTTGTESVALDAWRAIEADVVEVKEPRSTLWQTDPGSAAHALLGLLGGVFGESEKRVTLAHHGFYFYTPQQWRFFRAVEEAGVADQLFFVHNDGELPVFDVWSGFFDGRWNLTSPVATQVPGHMVSAAALALADALRGRRVDEQSLAASLAIKECRSPAELVRLWREAPASEREARGRRFAAKSEEVARFVDRLSGIGSDQDVDLAQLPVGSFILSLHAALHVDDGGKVAVRLSPDGVMSIARSGFLARAVSGAQIAPLERALPFFRRCSSAEDWRRRADQLDTVVREVSEFHQRVESPDLDRMRAAVTGYFAVVPWLDLSVAEARAVRESIHALVDLLEELAAHERVTWSDHWAIVVERLATGLKAVSSDERALIESKVAEVSIGLEGEMHVDGIVDAVTMVLGRSVQFEAEDDMDNLQSSQVSEPRAMDALGFAGASGSFHLANLADTAFPTKIGGVGWPFSPESISGGPLEAREILEARGRAGTLSSLYLFWLALDAATDEAPLTLSWISQRSGEQHAPSPFIALLAQLRGVDPELGAELGGVRIDEVSPAEDVTAEVGPPELPTALATDDDLMLAVARIPAGARSSALACPRRFALQWALGDSAAFTAEHHWLIAYGNVVGALQRDLGMSESKARGLANLGWGQFTPGELESSLANRRVQPGRSADARWVLTLGGSRDGDKPIDRAYQAALAGYHVPEPRALVPEGSRTLPEGVRSAEVCRLCPVRPRCLHLAIE